VRRRGGFSLAESLVSLILTGLILSVLGRTMVSIRSALRATTSLSEQVEAARVGRHLVDRVASAGGVLPESAGPGEVRVHLPVGWAEVCDSAFVWRGIRAPDPDRDSAVVLDAHARWHRVGVAESGAGSCPAASPAAGRVRRIAFDPVVQQPRLARVYESGVIRVDDAVRYARRSTPRQPLTAPVLERTSSYAEGGPDGVRLRIESTEGRVWGRSWWNR